MTIYLRSLQLLRLGFNSGIVPVNWLLRIQRVVSWFALPTVSGMDPVNRLSSTIKNGMNERLQSCNMTPFCWEYIRCCDLLRMSIDNLFVKSSGGILLDNLLESDETRGDYIW